MSGLAERLAREHLEREKYHAPCEAALVELVHAALDEAAQVARDHGQHAACNGPMHCNEEIALAILAAK